MLTQDELKQAKYRYLNCDLSLRELGKEFGVTHETLRQMFIRAGLRVDRSGQSLRVAEDLEARAFQSRDEIREIYKRVGNVEKTAREIGLPLKYVRVHITEADRKLYTHKGKRPDEYAVEEVLEALRVAARICGEPLTVPDYTAVAPDAGLPAPATVVRFFDGDWSAACAAAGVGANQPRGRRTDSISLKECQLALRDYRDQHRRIPSYSKYSRWAKERGRPSAGTVRSKTASGTWREALELAFPELYE